MPAATSAAQFHVISELVRQAYRRATTGFARIFHDMPPAFSPPTQASLAESMVRPIPHTTNGALEPELLPYPSAEAASKPSRRLRGAKRKCGTRTFDAHSIQASHMSRQKSSETLFFRAARTASLMASGASAQAARLAWLPFRRGFRLREGSFSVAGRWEPLSYRELTSLVWFEQS
jgi:hypothetical protein